MTSPIHDLAAEAERDGDLAAAFDRIKARIRAEDAAIGPYGSRRRVIVELPPTRTEYRIGRPLEIDRPNMVLRSEPGTVAIYNTAGTPAVRIHPRVPVEPAARVPFADLGLSGNRWALRTSASPARWVAFQGTPIDRGHRHWRDTRQFCLELRLSGLEPGKPIPAGAVLGIGAYAGIDGPEGGGSPWSLSVGGFWESNALIFSFATTSGDPAIPGDVRDRSPQRRVCFDSRGKGSNREITVQVDLETGAFLVAVDGEIRTPLPGTATRPLSAGLGEPGLRLVPNFVKPLLIGAVGLESTSAIYPADRIVSGLRILAACPYRDDGGRLARRDGRTVTPDRYFDRNEPGCLGLLPLTDPPSESRFVATQHGVIAGPGQAHGLTWGGGLNPAIESVELYGLTLRNAIPWGQTLALGAVRDLRVERCGFEGGYWNVGSFGPRNDWTADIRDISCLDGQDAAIFLLSCIANVRGLRLDHLGHAAIRWDASQLNVSDVVSNMGRPQTEVWFRGHCENTYGAGQKFRDILIDQEGHGKHYAVFHLDSGLIMPEATRLEGINFGALAPGQAGVLLASRVEQWELEGRAKLSTSIAPGFLALRDWSALGGKGVAVVRDSPRWSVEVGASPTPLPVVDTDRGRGTPPPHREDRS